MDVDCEIAAFINEVVLDERTPRKIGKFNTPGISVDTVGTDEDVRKIGVNAGASVADDPIVDGLASARVNASGIAAGIIIMGEGVAGIGGEHKAGSAVGNRSIVESFDVALQIDSVRAVVMRRVVMEACASVGVIIGCVEAALVIASFVIINFRLGASNGDAVNVVIGEIVMEG